MLLSACTDGAASSSQGDITADESPDPESDGGASSDSGSDSQSGMDSGLGTDQDSGASADTGRHGDAGADGGASATCESAMTCAGSLAIVEPADLDPAEQCAVVEGMLEVSTDEWLTSLSLPCLSSVRGSAFSSWLTTPPCPTWMASHRFEQCMGTCSCATTPA